MMIIDAKTTLSMQVASTGSKFEVLEIAEGCNFQ